MVQNQLSMESCIRDLLERWGLFNFTDIFLQNGYDDINIIREINENDLIAMGITCKNQASFILDTLARLNEMFLTYISIEEVESRPSAEKVLSCVADKLEREGVLPSGQDIVTLVLDKLENEEILLHPYNYQAYITKEGHESTRREYNILRVRYAQELFLPNQSISEALKLIHEITARGQPPPKPPKPKVVPIYDSKTGKLIWVNQESSNYENVNYLYEFIHQLTPLEDSPTSHPVIPPTPPALPSRSNSVLTFSTQPSSTTHSGEVSKEGLRFDTTPSQDSSPAPSRAVKKKPTLFKRFKHNLFGKSNCGLDSNLASSTKTLISDRSSDCSSSKLGFFYKGKSKKEKQGRLERQRSNSAPEAARNVNLKQIPESDHPPSQPVYARPYRRPSCTSRDSCKCCGPNDIYTHVFPTKDQMQATPLPPTPLHCDQFPLQPSHYPHYSNRPQLFPTHQPPPHYSNHPPHYPPPPPFNRPPIPPPVYHSPVKHTKSDTFSDTSVSSGSVSGDSAYSSKPCLNAIRSSQRPVVYGPLTANPGHVSVPLPVASRSPNTDQSSCTKCSCCSHVDNDS